MANLFTIKPSLSTPFPAYPTTWKCPRTGLIVPKVPEVNLAWRAKLLQRAETDPGLQSELMAACRESLLFWVNAFVFTFRVFEGGADGRSKQATSQHVPFVTWPIQDEHMVAIEEAINNATSMLTDKTRDMGASWSHAVVFDHQYRFRPNSMFLEMSRTEKDVDDPGNPKALFVKHDYIYNWLPEWMREHRRRTTLHIHNLSNGSRIDGESSNAAAGSGDRRRAVLLDEFSKMHNATRIKGSLRDVSPCLLPNSTPWGPGTEYSKWRNSGQIRVFVLPWWEHPEKGKDRYVKDEEDGKWKIRSPWYDHQCSIRTTREVAQEIDMDHIGSGDTFFEANVVESHRGLYARPARSKATIDFKRGLADDDVPEVIRRKSVDRVRVAQVGSWRLWCRTIDGRPDQTRTYTFGIDISKGQGASNSVISVFCNETREKVAEYADANVPPYELARLAVAAAIWFGGAGSRLPLMVWEANGPGWDFGRQVVRVYQYPYYFVDKSAGTITEKASKRYGWHSSREKKEIVLGMYRRALAHGGYINHSAEALDEALTYIYYENGGLGPASLSEESIEARKTHGDRVIADMLCLLGVEEMPRTQKKSFVPPTRSPAGRKRLRDQQRAQARHTKTFDFRGAR